MHLNKPTITKTLTMVLSALILLVILSSCALNSKTDELQMKEKGYTVHDITTFYKMEDASIAKAYDYSNSKHSVIVLYFETASDAKSYYKNYEDSNAVRSGNIVYWGDYQAKKDYESISHSSGALGSMLPFIIVITIISWGVGIAFFALRATGVIKRESDGKWHFVYHTKENPAAMKETEQSDTDSHADS